MFARHFIFSSVTCRRELFRSASEYGIEYKTGTYTVGTSILFNRRDIVVLYILPTTVHIEAICCIHKMTVTPAERSIETYTSYIGKCRETLVLGCPHATSQGSIDM